MAADFAFVHGGGQGSWAWKETVAALRRQAGDALGRVLTLDVPGCGDKRGRDTAALHVDDVASELIRDVLAAGLEQVILVGHSLAGTLLPRLAEKRADLIARIVYVSCSAPLAGQTVAQMMGNGRHGSNPDSVGYPRDPKDCPVALQYREMFCNDMGDGDASLFIAKLGADRWPDQVMRETAWRYAHLEGIQSTYVLCLRDAILTAPWQEVFAGRLKARRIVRIDAGHQVMMTRPQALAEALAMASATRPYDAGYTCS
jgi:pimeloyl-ACP methyl ester carboxylesterase